MIDPKGDGALRFSVSAWAKTALRKFPYGHGQVYRGEGRVGSGHLREQARATLLAPASRRCSSPSISKGGREHAPGVRQVFARGRRLKRSVAYRFTGGSASRRHRSDGCLVFAFLLSSHLRATVGQGSAAAVHNPSLQRTRAVGCWVKLS